MMTIKHAATWVLAAWCISTAATILLSMLAGILWPGLRAYVGLGTLLLFITATGVGLYVASMDPETPIQ